MTDTNITIVGVIVGMLLVFFFIGIGVIISDVRHYFADKRKLGDDPGDDACICERGRDRSDDNGSPEQIDSEEVVAGLGSLRMALSSKEKEYLDYACECVMAIRNLRGIVDERRNQNDNND